MIVWNWTVSSAARHVWIWCLKRPGRGQVTAATRSEARAAVKRQLGIHPDARLPESVILY